MTDKSIDIAYNTQGSSITSGTAQIAAITGATAADPVVITAVAHGFASTDLVRIVGVGGMTEINDLVFNITVVTADTFSLQDASDVNVDGAANAAWSSGGLATVRKAAVVSAITIATPPVVTATAHGFSNGDEVRIEDVGGMTQVNDRSFTIANKADNTFELTDHNGDNIEGAVYTAWSSNGVAAVTLQVLCDTGTAVITKADPAVVTTFTHGLTNGDVVTITDCVGMTEVNDRAYIVTVLSSTTFDIADAATTTDVDSSAFTVHSAGGVVTWVRAAEITAITAATPPVVTCVSAHGFIDGEIVEIQDVVGMTEVNGRSYIVANKAATTLELTDRNGNNIIGAGYTALSSSGVAIKTLSATISAATAATPVVVTTDTHGFLDGDIVEISGVAGMTELNGLSFVVANKAATTFELTGTTGLAYTAYTSGGEASLAPTVTNAVRIIYDDSKNKSEIVDAVQRGKEVLAQILNPGG